MLPSSATPTGTESSRAAALQRASHRLGPEHARDAEHLLAHLLGVGRAQLLAALEEPLPATACARYAALVERRAAGEPLAYLTGQREFWSLTLHVTPAVLVPRPESELLVERALTLVPQSQATALDLGTGSGALAIALATERPHWRILATDRSSAALDVARDNSHVHACSNVEFAAGEWLAALEREQRFDVIVSNPPYLASHDPALASDGLRHEPRTALVAPGDGLEDLRTIIQQAPAHLRAGGWLALEHGAAQGAAVRELLVARGFLHVRSHLDLAGHERVTEGAWP
jgi:release factor glutamine methyltransferase